MQMEPGEMIGYQVVLRLADDRVMAPDARGRRALASVVLAAGRERGLLAFGAADTHLHLLAQGDRRGAGLLARGVELGLRSALALPIGFAAPAITPIQDQNHLRSAFGYVQRNARRHGIVDPTATEASSLHDLLGMRRVAPWLVDRVRGVLPRVTRATLLELIALPGLGTLGDVGPDLADATAAVFALPCLEGNSAGAVRARVTGISLVKGEWTPASIGRTFGVGERAVRRLATLAPDPMDVQSLRRQLAWRAAVGLVAPPASGF